MIQAPKIDGELNDVSWVNAEMATDFIQRAPKPGVPCSQKTEIRVIYDDVAIYIGAQMFDSRPDSILRELSQRDNEANADLFGLFFDTYNDDINGYGFFVTSAGVQIDARYSANGQDFNWNAVWQSKVIFNDKGWSVEFRIPYSSLRFSAKEKQDWGVNFIRKIRKTREDAFWNEVKPGVAGLMNQSGDLTGIENIKSPLRLSVTPYVSAYLENYPYDQEGKSNNSYSLNGGMDIKYGINESFTLDMTLVPDFGQVQSDNKVLNLSPFEVQYNENRQFFTEGTELFNKGGLFYSRRIGGAPVNYFAPYAELKEGEVIRDNPSATQLINATKISGRTSSNLGIGLFNGTTAVTYAVLTDTNGVDRQIVTQPLTNYNVLVFDQALRNNSYISLINTNVTREGHVYDANVTGTQFKFVEKKNTYGVDGSASLSQIYHADSSKPDLGYSYNFFAGKISGEWQYFVGCDVKSKTYDPNDMGILFLNNTLETFAELSYTHFQPVWRVNNYSLSGGVGYSRLYQPGKFWNFNIYGNGNTTFTKNFMSTGFGFNLEPITTYDHWEPRITGNFYTYPKNYMGNYWFSSDYRKRFALDGRVRYRYFEENNRNDFAFGIAPRFRVNNKLSFNYNYDRVLQTDDIGFVNYDDFSKRITFGRRNVLTVTNQLNASYIFTNRMSLSLRGRHYWSKAEYSQYYSLSDKGYLFDDTQYKKDHNVNFNAFNIDMIYTWQFSPGSEMSVVWKNAIYTSDNVILTNYKDDFSQTIDSPQTNSFSIKVLYYLDYSMLKKRNKKVNRKADV
ncbi:MAG: carbohydrate binding family 9 domain-containing protein [Bacteroidota bacterium]|nr:carbohydrate binding family 9 domain-containing protein [Bacteroidota bacterium]